MTFVVNDVSQLDVGMTLTFLTRNPDGTDFQPGDTAVITRGRATEHMGNADIDTIHVGRGTVLNYWLNTSGFGTAWTVTSETAPRYFINTPEEIESGMLISIDRANVDETEYIEGEVVEVLHPMALENLSFGDAPERNVNVITVRTYRGTPGWYPARHLQVSGLNRDWHIHRRSPPTAAEKAIQLYRGEVGGSILSLSRGL